MRKYISPVLMCADMRRVATLGDDASVWPNSPVRVQLLWAVRLIVVEACDALRARVGLGAHADTLASLDIRDLGSNSKGLANDLCVRVQPESAACPSLVSFGDHVP